MAGLWLGFNELFDLIKTFYYSSSIVAAVAVVVAAVAV